MGDRAVVCEVRLTEALRRVGLVPDGCIRWRLEICPGSVPIITTECYVHQDLVDGLEIEMREFELCPRITEGDG